MKHFLLLLIFCSGSSIAQNTITLSGKILNEQSEGLEGVDVQLLNSDVSSKSGSGGTYELKFPSRFKECDIAYSLEGFVKEVVHIKTDKQLFINKDIVLLKNINQLDAVTINSSNGNQATLQTLNQSQIQNYPSASGNFESLLKTLPGVSSNNELSSQYSVRGGNFDENLIYINEIEIFKPLLIRNGQQEGLSFINPELVSKASFSAGGFEAKYGEKLSSVLDVRYYKPDSSQITASVGLLGLSASIKVPSKNAYFLAGVRTKTNRNILKTQQTKGSYQPKFYDLQALYNVDLNKKLTFSAFGYYNLSRFYIGRDAGDKLTE
ncbi:MAG: TonB-dependent receptor plug domain-containing protein, partial [Sphingobacteriaceae bacterium]